LPQESHIVTSLQMCYVTLGEHKEDTF
jgi:hypothetical protein